MTRIKVKIQNPLKRKVKKVTVVNRKAKSTKVKIKLSDKKMLAKKKTKKTNT